MTAIRQLKLLAAALMIGTSLILAINCSSSGGGSPGASNGSLMTSEVTAGSMVDIKITEGELAGFDLEGAAFAGGEDVEVSVQKVAATSLTFLNDGGAEFSSAGPAFEIKAKKKTSGKSAVVDGTLTLRLPVDLAALQAFASEQNETLDADFVARRVVVKVDEEDGSQRVVIPAPTGHVLSGDTPTILVAVKDFSKFHPAFLRSLFSLDLAGSNANVDAAIDAFNSPTIDLDAMKIALDAAFDKHRHSPRAKLWQALYLIAKAGLDSGLSSSGDPAFKGPQDILTSLGATHDNGAAFELQVSKDGLVNSDLNLPETVGGDPMLPSAGNTSDRLLGWLNGDFAESLREAQTLLGSLPSDFSESYDDGDGTQINLDSADVAMMRAGLNATLFLLHFFKAYQMDGVNFANIINDAGDGTFSINGDFLNTHPNFLKLHANFAAELANGVTRLRAANMLYRSSFDRLAAVATAATPDLRTNHAFKLDADDPDLNKLIADEDKTRAFVDKALASINSGAFTEDFADFNNGTPSNSRFTQFNLRPLLGTGVSLRDLLPTLLEEDDKTIVQFPANYDSTFGGIIPQATQSEINDLFSPVLVTPPTATITVNGLAGAGEWPAASLIVTLIDPSGRRPWYAPELDALDENMAAITELRAAKSGNTLNLRLDYKVDLAEDPNFPGQDLKTSAFFSITNLTTGEDRSIEFTSDTSNNVYLNSHFSSETLSNASISRVGKVMEVSIDLNELASKGFLTSAGNNIEIKVSRTNFGSSYNGFSSDDSPGFIFKR